MKNIVYKIELSQLKSDTDISKYEKYKFKELGYITLYWWYEENNPLTNFHGFITHDELKNIIGQKQYAKFCHGKRIFIMKRRID